MPCNRTCNLAFKYIVISFLTFFLLFCCALAAKHKGGYLHPLSEEVYDTLLLLVQGKFNVPVAQRTREQRNAVVRYWRNQDHFHLGPQTSPTLYFDGKKVVKRSSIPSLVSRTFDQAKSGGCKKLRNRAAVSFAGLSERNILRVTNNDLKYRIHNAKFNNKATPKPVTAKRIQGQHQIDLMDLSKDPVKHRGRVYKYVLSVIDVFSRYLWLRPLEKKSSSCVASSLGEMYSEHGPPDRLQSDRGTEFEGNVRDLCKKLKIKRIKSRPYHPQSQGKVERSHRRLRKKMMFDLVSLGKNGVNWAASLGDYNRILNEECKEELGWKSPFEIYFGRKSNTLVKASLDCVDSDDGIFVTKAPRKRDLAEHFDNVKKLRQRVKHYTEMINERTVKRHKRLHKTEKYKLKEKVLVRYRPKKGGSLPAKKRFVVEGTVVKKSKINCDMYKIRFVPPNSSEHKEQWISVEDITSLQKHSTSSGLSRHPESASKSRQNVRLKQLRKKLNIPLTARDRFLDRDFSDMDLSLVFNPPGDGNCQFGALCFWLNRLGIHRSPESVRDEIVEYLSNNPNNIDGIPLELFAAMPWPEYLQAMAKAGTYGDHLTLQAAADIYNIEILVVSTLGPDATTLISPISSIPIARVQLGHYAEGHGDHYICIDGGVLLSEEEPPKEGGVSEPPKEGGVREPPEERGVSEPPEVGRVSEPPEEGGVSEPPEEGRVSEPPEEGRVSEPPKEGGVSKPPKERGVSEPPEEGGVSGRQNVLIHFVPNGTVRTVVNNSTEHMNRLPNEILERIVFIILSSSDFSWPDHICHVYNQLRGVNTRFREITRRLTSLLPRIYFSSDGEAGIISVRSLMKKFGSWSGLVLQVRRIVSDPKWANAWLRLQYDGQGWFIIIAIFWRKK